MSESYVNLDFVTADAKAGTLRFTDTDTALQTFKLVCQADNVNYCTMVKITPSRHGEGYVPEHCEELAAFNRYMDGGISSVIRV